MFRKALLVTASFLVLIGCDKNDNPMEPETSMFRVTIENIALAKAFFASGVFNTPVGAADPAPIGPGAAYEFSFSAAPGAFLSFATMFVHSNDLFYAPTEGGITLFDGAGNQMLGDVTAQIKLWDAGTEVNEEPGLGMNQAPRQAGPNTGAADANMNVREATDDFTNLPAVEDVIKVTITSTSATGFTVRIENVSDATTLLTSDAGSHAVPLAPGVWVIHTDTAPLFTMGQPDRSEGLEAIAEDGNPVDLGGLLASQSGITQLIAPGVWTVHEDDNPLFVSGNPDSGEGLESLAEDGDPSILAGSVDSKSGIIASGVFNTPDGSASPAPAGPGASYSFDFEVSEGYLSFATMLVQTNDLFYAPTGMGIDLFDADGMAISGDITSQIRFWDAGTEVNEEPGVGLNQAPRQTGANTGANENGTVREVNDAYTYPAVSEVIRVTITRL